MLCQFFNSLLCGFKHDRLSKWIIMERRSPALGRDRAGKRQLRPARFASVAGSCVQKTATRHHRSVRRTSASAPSLRLAADNAPSKLEERGTLSHQAGWLRRFADPQADPERLRHYLVSVRAQTIS